MNKGHPMQGGSFTEVAKEGGDTCCTMAEQWPNKGKGSMMRVLKKQSDESCPIRPTSLELHRELSV